VRTSTAHELDCATNRCGTRKGVVVHVMLRLVGVCICVQVCGFFGLSFPNLVPAFRQLNHEVQAQRAPTLSRTGKNIIAIPRILCGF
jgi:hypothetical protein